MQTPLKPKVRPVGRPKMGVGAKTTIVPVRFSAEDRQRVEAAAKSRGQTVSDWIRDVLNRSIQEN